MSDTAADRWPEAADRKRVRTAWRLRHRYRLAQRLASLAGAALALAIVATVVTRLPDRAAALDRGFVVASAALVLVCAGLPWLTVGTLWRRTSRRNRHEWSEGALLLSPPLDPGAGATGGAGLNPKPLAVANAPEGCSGRLAGARTDARFRGYRPALAVAGRVRPRGRHLATATGVVLWRERGTRGTAAKWCIREVG